MAEQEKGERQGGGQRGLITVLGTPEETAWIRTEEDHRAATAAAFRRDARDARRRGNEELAGRYDEAAARLEGEPSAR